MKRKSFVFYESFLEAIELLPEEEQLSVYRAIVTYGIEGEEIDLTGAARIAFVLIKPIIDKNNQRYQNGLKGGRPASIDDKKTTKAKPNQNQTRTKPEPNWNQTRTKPEPDDDVDDDADDDDEKTKKDGDNYHHHNFFKAWNCIDGVSPIHSIKPGSQRERMLNARIDEHGKDGVLQAIRHVQSSKFLRGGNDRGWRASFDWLLKPSNFLKVLEGTYDDRESEPSSVDRNAIPKGWGAAYDQRVRGGSNRDSP